MTRHAGGSYFENQGDLEEAVKKACIRNAVSKELALHVANPEELIDEVLNKIEEDDLDSLTAQAVRLYCLGYEENFVFSVLYFCIRPEVDNPPPVWYSNMVMLCPPTPQFFIEPKKIKTVPIYDVNTHRRLVKYPNEIQGYEEVIPPEFCDSHCGQTCVVHLFMHVRREKQFRLFAEMSRAPLPYLDLFVDNLYSTVEANKAGDMLRTKATLEYTREIFENKEMRSIGTWLNRKFGVTPIAAKMMVCKECEATERLLSRCCLNLRDLQKSFMEKSKELFQCKHCKKKSKALVIKTIKNAFFVDCVDPNVPYYGVGIAELEQHLPRFLDHEGIPYILKSLLVVVPQVPDYLMGEFLAQEWTGHAPPEWTSDIPEDIDEDEQFGYHSILVDVMGHDQPQLTLKHVCDGEAEIWGNTRNDEIFKKSRIDIAIYWRDQRFN